MGVHSARGLPTAVLVLKLRVLCPGTRLGSSVIPGGGDPQGDARRRKESNREPFPTGQAAGREETTVPWAQGLHALRGWDPRSAHG